jgi:hypothetical protein
MNSLSGSDFLLQTDTAMYVPLENRSSVWGEDWIQIIFDRIIQDPGAWAVLIRDTVRDLAGNSTDAGSKTVNR